MAPTRVFCIVCVECHLHANLKSIGLEQLDGPVDSMNLSSDSRDDESRHMEQLFIIIFELRMVRRDGVAHSIMLPCENLLQHGDAKPTILRVANKVIPVPILSQNAGLVRKMQLPANARPTAVDHLVILPVHEAGVPPMGADVIVKAVVTPLGLVEPELAERTAGHIVGKLDNIIRGVEMAEPIVTHGLNPSSSEDIKLIAGWFKPACTREQTLRDELYGRTARVCAGLCGRHVASEGGHCGACVGMVGVCTESGGGSVVWGRRERVGGGKRGWVEVYGLHDDATGDEGDSAEETDVVGREDVGDEEEETMAEVRLLAGLHGGGALRVTMGMEWRKIGKLGIGENARRKNRKCYGAAFTASVSGIR